jgi:hypothetical protein
MVYCTATRRETLISKGVDEKRIRKIAPGDILNFGPFEVRVLKGTHILFDVGLIIKKVFNPRILFNWKNARYMLNENRKCVEACETMIMI